jgi:hypothetical protein
MTQANSRLAQKDGTYPFKAVNSQSALGCASERFGRLIRFALVFTAFGLTFANAESTGYAPVTIKDGTFTRDGKPFIAYGINDFGAFYKKLGVRDEDHPGIKIDPDNRSYIEDFAVFKKYGIPFFRTPICGFYPGDWKFYLTDKATYFKMLDGFVKDVEREHLLFIPNLFWMPQSLPAALGEPVGAWGDPHSATRQIMREATLEIVKRYRDSPAILGWEFSNEFLLDADIPGQVGKKLWWNRPKLGFSPEFRAEDQLTRSQIRDVYAEFARTVRAVDPERPIFTGDSLPRTASNGLMKGKGWVPDSPDQWFSLFEADNPAPVNTMTIHWYYDGLNPNPSNRPPQISQTEMLGRIMAESRRLKMPLFVGEFGPQVAPLDTDQRKKQLSEILKMLAKEHVQLSAYWVYDYPDPAGFKCAPGSPNDYALEMLRQANQSVAADPAEIR